MSLTAKKKSVSSTSSHSKTDYSDLFKDCDQHSMHSAMTQDVGYHRSNIRIDPPLRDEQITKELATSILGQCYKLFSGICCGGMNANYVNEMIQSKRRME